MPIKEHKMFCTIYKRTEKEKEQDKALKTVEETKKELDKNKSDLKKANKKITS